MKIRERYNELKNRYNELNYECKSELLGAVIMYFLAAAGILTAIIIKDSSLVILSFLPGVFAMIFALAFRESMRVKMLYDMIKELEIQ